MIITHARKIKTADPAAFAWAGLRKFQNVDQVTRTLIDLHQVPKRFHEDVRKQAQQIRYCLTQAREYFTAASSVTTATQPNLLYYGTMSFALAEILFKQDGMSSLDKAREENRHHGLVMSMGDIPKNADLLTAARKLRARPHFMSGARRGTFELWHRSSREPPLAGDITTNFENGTSTIAYNVIMTAIDKPYPPIPDNGLTFEDCLSGLPLMQEHLSLTTNILGELIRGRVTSTVHRTEQWTQNIEVVLHPSPLYRELINSLSVPASYIDQIDLQDGDDTGRIYMHSNWISGHAPIPFPPASTVNTNEWRMWTNKPKLNEFGYHYVALYLAGNYARYFPDKWLSDVETSSPLALAIEELCAISGWRVPWLALSELDQTMYVSEA